MLALLSLLLLASASLSHAGFSNTFSLLAWSDDAKANPESFRPFASKGSQDYQVSLAQAQGEECIPALIVSAPSFSHDDLALLPASSRIRQGWTSAQSQLHLPYLGKPSAANLKMLIDRRLGACDASQTIFKQVKPVAKSGMDEKVRWMRELDTLVERNLEKLPESHIVILSSVPDLGLHYRQKRQITDKEWEQLIEEVNDEESSDIGVDDSAILDGPSSAPSKPFSVFEQDSNGSNNATVDPSLGLLYRYSFTTPPLIFTALVTLLLLIPTILYAISAITSIELLKGLENGKMIGGQLGEAKKDQ